MLAKPPAREGQRPRCPRFAVVWATRTLPLPGFASASLIVPILLSVTGFAKDLRQREYLASTVGAFASEMASSDGKWPFLKTGLYPYQVEGALHLATKGRAILADEMGLGKTVQAIAAALLLREVAKIGCF